MREAEAVLVVTADDRRRERAEAALRDVARPLWAGDLASALEAVSVGGFRLALVDAALAGEAASHVLSALGEPSRAVLWVERFRDDLFEYGGYIQVPHTISERALAAVLRWLMSMETLREASRSGADSSPDLERLHEVISRVRHDLNNPLTAVLAEAQLLLMDRDRFSAEHAKSLETVEAQAQRMRALVKELSELKRR